MEIAEILNELERNRGYYPEKAVEEALRRQIEITPHLLRAIEIAVDKAELIAFGSEYFLHFFAIHIIASFREQQAYPLIIRMCRLPTDQLKGLLGDALYESLPRVLASVFDGNIEPVKSIIEDPSLSEFARGNAIASLRLLAQEDIIPRESVIEYYGRLFRGGLERKYSNVWNMLVSEAADIYAKSLRSEIYRAYEDDLVDLDFISKSDVERCFRMSEEEVLLTARKRWGGLIDDVHGFLRGWACFNPEPVLPEFFEGNPVLQGYGTYVRESPKTGRNDPCPCGSGKKYKKCCSR
ncbi:MAG: DUF1186 domain-containing protein [Candidatus Aegiribacteria sp.]|nr:DUF1186 domain-containing protein [Candidatus Aegiribacteria sp.]